MIGKILYAISYQKNIYAVRVTEYKKRDEEVYQIMTEIAEPELIEREDLYHFNDSLKSVNYSKTNTLRNERDCTVNVKRLQHWSKTKLKKKLKKQKIT